jgi:hypothetical protein
MSDAIMLNIIMLNVIIVMLSVYCANAVFLSVGMVDAIILNVVELNVALPRYFDVCFKTIFWELKQKVPEKVINENINFISKKFPKNWNKKVSRAFTKGTKKSS